MDVNDISPLRKVVGYRQVERAVNLGLISKLILATDADADFEKKVLTLASANYIPVIRKGTKIQIAEVCGIDKIATVVGIYKEQE